MTPTQKLRLPFISSLKPKSVIGNMAMPSRLSRMIPSRLSQDGHERDAKAAEIGYRLCPIRSAALGERLGGYLDQYQASSSGRRTVGGWEYRVIGPWSSRRRRDWPRAVIDQTGCSRDIRRQALQPCLYRRRQTPHRVPGGSHSDRAACLGTLAGHACGGPGKERAVECWKADVSDIKPVSGAVFEAAALPESASGMFAWD